VGVESEQKIDHEVFNVRRTSLCKD